MDLWYDFKLQNVGVGVVMDEGRASKARPAGGRAKETARGDLVSRHEAVAAEANSPSLAYCGYVQ
jgi:hypothetical protein